MSVKPPIVQLCIPQLFQPIALWHKDFLFEAEAPELTRLLRRFDIVQNKPIQGLEACLFDVLGMDANQELPVAYYRYQANKHSLPKKMIVCADPIHLEVGMNDITLTERITDVSDVEADEIIDALNKHFEQDGLLFERGEAHQWYIHLPKHEVTKTTPLNQVLRKNIANNLPQSDLRNWYVIQNESQMLLHHCSVNQQREIAGLSAINSLWFWGAGEPLKRNNANLVNILYNETAQESAKMIAEAANCQYSILSNELPEFEAGKTLVILDQLLSPATHDNLDAYQEALTQLDVNVLQPLSHAWKAGKIELLIDGCDGKILKPTKLKSWRFWGNKSVSLVSIAQFIEDKGKR